MNGRTLIREILEMSLKVTNFKKFLIIPMIAKKMTAILIKTTMITRMTRGSITMISTDLVMRTMRTSRKQGLTTRTMLIFHFPVETVFKLQLKEDQTKNKILMMTRIYLIISSKVKEMTPLQMPLLQTMTN